MVRKWTEAMDRAKYPEAYEAMGKYTSWLQKKARPILDKLPVPSEFYDEKWQKLLGKYPDLCGKIEQVFVDCASIDEYNALKKQVKEQGLILEELWKHRVKGVPYESVAVEKFSEEETKGMRATAQVFAYKINEVIDAIQKGHAKQ